MQCAQCAGGTLIACSPLTLWVLTTHVTNQALLCGDIKHST